MAVTQTLFSATSHRCWGQGKVILFWEKGFLWLSKCGTGSKPEGAVRVVWLQSGQALQESILHLNHSLSFVHFCF